MYFADWGKEPVIERAALDGQFRTAIMRNVGRANGLTIDFADQRLFWTDLDANLIESADLTGTSKRNIPPPLAIMVRTKWETFCQGSEVEVGDGARGTLNSCALHPTGR